MKINMEKLLSDELINSLTKDELWEMLFSSENKAEPHDQDFSYDDMKIMFSLYKYAGGTGIS